MSLSEYENWLLDYFKDQNEIIPPTSIENLVDKNRLKGAVIPTDEGLFLYEENGSFAEKSDLISIKTFVINQIKKKNIDKSNSDNQPYWIYLDLEAHTSKSLLISLLVMLKSINIEYKVDLEGKLYSEFQ